MLLPLAMSESLSASSPSDVGTVCRHDWPAFARRSTTQLIAVTALNLGVEPISDDKVYNQAPALSLSSTRPG